MRIAALAFTLLAAIAAAAPADHFAIRVIDEATGRGVPLVELKTTSEIRLYTDSAGWAAFHEPGLMDTDVFFTVTSDGYEHQADGFGMRGRRLRTTPGTETTIPIRRTMIAERLYRMTGQGIYRDSVLLGKETPLAKPLLNGRVAGQDSTQAVIYRDRIFWLWGDTGRPEYPLGNFACSVATSLLPSQGGLAPSVGIDFTYFEDANGFSRGMVDVPGEGVKWLDGFMLLRDAEGRERLVARCERMKDLGTQLGRSLVIYDDAREMFIPFADYDRHTPLHPQGQPFRHTVDGVEYFYFPTPIPTLRVPATWEAIVDPARYEGYTPLAPGSRDDGTTVTLDRDAAGAIRWGWKANTPSLNYKRERELVASGQLREDEAWIRTTDALTGEAVHLWGGSVCWNEYRKAWVLIAYQMFGKPSGLGEIWLAQAPEPHGPWTRAHKIVTHAQYTLYNPVQHPFFDEEGGRVIYFDGTYSELFSPAHPTPRYNYNTIMFRVDLADPRLAIPATP